MSDWTLKRGFSDFVYTMCIEMAQSDLGLQDPTSIALTSRLPDSVQCSREWVLNSNYLTVTAKLNLFQIKDRVLNVNRSNSVQYTTRLDCKRT